MFENDMPEGVDAQAAELDFEGQPAPAEQQPAAQESPQPAYQPPEPQYADDFKDQLAAAEQQYAEPQQVEQGLSEQEIWERLEEIAEEQGPLQAAAILSQLQMAPLAEAMQQQMQEQIAPVVEEFHTRQGEVMAEALRQEYGADAIASIAAPLGDLLERDASFYQDERTGQLRFDRVQMVVDSLLARGGLPIDQDELTRLSIDPVAGSDQRDQFGRQAGNGPRTRIAQRADGRYVDNVSGRVLSQHELRQLAGRSRQPAGNVFVEGGSSPPPPAPPPMTVDDSIKAEIDAAAAGEGRDAFGRRQRSLRR